MICEDLRKPHSKDNHIKKDYPSLQRREGLITAFRKLSEKKSQHIFEEVLA
jgi:hypothetical protein